jgi:integrin beta 3
MDNIAKFADSILCEFKGYLQRSLAPVMDRIKALDERISAIPAGPKGEPGERGEPGEKGLDGKDADESVIAEKVSVAVSKAVESIPAPKDGRDGEPGKDGKDGAAGKDGEKGERGERGEPGPQGDPGIQGEKGIDGKDGAPGKSAYEIAVEKGFPGSEVDWLNALKGMSGENGKDGREGVDGRDGRDGEPGRDAIHVEVLDGIDPAKKYQRGTFAHFRGGIVRSFRVTDAMGGGAELEKAGWHVVVNGIDSESETELDDGRFVERTTTYTSGKSFTRKHVRAVMVDRGIFKAETQYLKGDVVTWDGSMWIAQEPTSDKPGESKTWRMSVRKGRDGRDGLRGEKGERGAEGRAGKDLTQVGPDGGKW